NGVLVKSKSAIGYDNLDGSTDVAKVSVIGIGMRSHAGVAAQAFKALAGRQINIRAITTSEIKFSLLIDAAYTELAVRTLHALYGLDQVREMRLRRAALELHCLSRRAGGRSGLFDAARVGLSPDRPRLLSAGKRER